MRLKLEEFSGVHDRVVITEWYVKEKELLSQGQDIFEVSTDKATFDVSSPCGGILERVFIREGETIGPRDDIAEISESSVSSKSL